MRIGTYLGLGLSLLAACEGGPAAVTGQRQDSLGLGAEVALLSASSSYCYSRCNSPEISAQVRVQNLAYDKQIALVVRNPAGGPWQELSGWYRQPLGAEHELWSVASFVAWQGDYEFAVKYTTAGHTYWDNNGGGNYLMHVSRTSAMDNTGGLVPTAVQLVSLPASVSPAGKIVGSVLLQNLGDAKKVTVIYSADHWTTTQTVAATFVAGPTLDAAETWSFTIAAPTAPANVELAVAYDVAGTTYWDSFFGRNYAVDVR